MVGGALLGVIHVFVLAYMALFVSAGCYKYVGPWAFFLNGTASAFVTALIVGIPLGVLWPRLALPFALVAGAAAAIFLVYLGVLSTTIAELWWIPVTDALQLSLLFFLGAWLGVQLRVRRNART